MIYKNYIIKIVNLWILHIIHTIYKDEICVLFYETLYSYNIKSTVINSYAFTADLYYIKIYTWYDILLVIVNCHHTWLGSGGKLISSMFSENS
jgi:hypothetical protein